MVNKGGTVSAELWFLQRIFCVQDTKYTNKEVKYKNFPHEVGTSWISEVQNWSESNSDDLQLPEKQTPRGLNRTRQAYSAGISDYTNLKKCLLMGREKKNYLQDGVKCVLHIRSEVRLDTFVNSALFHLTNRLVLRNTCWWWTTRHSTCSICSLGLSSII
jgi:hypothetical protein